MTTSESKGRFFLLNESIRITNRIDSNRELECSSIHQCSVTSQFTNPTTVTFKTDVISSHAEWIAFSKAIGCNCPNIVPA